MRIGIIDYGSGNFSSVYNTFCCITNQIIPIHKGEDLEKCTHIVLPGVGAYGACMQKLESMRIIPDLEEQVLHQKKPFLGICVGLQVLGEYGTEFEINKGLGWVGGYVDKLDVLTQKLPLPHMGWNELNNMYNSPLFKDVDNQATFYFVHSYVMNLKDDNEAKSVTFEYGNTTAIASISKDNIHGVQFHPEKSQLYGIQVLKNFINL